MMHRTISEATWHEDGIEPVEDYLSTVRPPLDLDDLDDGRCKASTWRGPRPQRPDYENHFGPGGFNRCIGREGHVNHLHKDEWGHVFTIDPVRVVRVEPTS